MNVETEKRPGGGRDAPSSLYLVLEGGGAKGIAHVAAWSALEELIKNNTLQHLSRKKFEIRELAGTSAGAMAAAMIAAGARADQLIDDQGRMPLASAVRIKFFYDLFGIDGWRRLQIWRFLLKPSKSMEAVGSRFRGEERRQRKATQNSLRAAQREIPSTTIIGRQRLLTRFGNFYDTVLALGSAIKTLFKIVFFVVLLALAGFVIEHLVFLGPTAFALYVLFWVTSGILLSITSKSARDWDAKRFDEGKSRHASTIRRSLTNPACSLLGALALTFTAFFVVPFSAIIAWVEHLIPTPLLRPVIYLSYAFCLVLALWTISAYARSVLKGVIKTGDLRRDINKALITVMTREEKLIEAEGRYEWVDKQPRNEKERLLFERLRREGHLVTFGDLEAMTGRKLSVVTADTINSRTLVISTRSHRDHDVATAVASSVAIPLAFRPMRVASTLLVDGGIVSSIPAWIFRRNRTHDPDSRILAIGIAPTKTEAWIPLFLRARDKHLSKSRVKLWVRTKFSLSHPWASMLWPLRFVANVAYTTAYGGRSLDLESSDRLDIVELGCTFHLIDFDRKRPEVAKELRSLKDEAAFWIEEKLWARREAFDGVCKEITDEMWRRARSAGYNRSGRFRIIWAEQEARVESLRIKERFGFLESELSDRLTLPFDSSVMGFSAATKECLFADQTVIGAMFAGWKDRYRQVYRWREMEWCWTIPIVDRKKGVAGVLGIQCDIPHGFFEPDWKREADLRTGRWLEGGRVRQDASGVVAGPRPDSNPDTPQMEALEKLWAERFRREYLDTDVPKFFTAVATQRSPNLIWNLLCSGWQRLYRLIER